MSVWMSVYAVSEWKTIYYVYSENNKRIPRRVQAVSSGCTETHTGGVSQILDGPEKHGAYFYGDAKVLRVLGTDTETRSLRLAYCRQGSVSGRLSYAGDTPWSQIIPWLRQIRETEDTRWIERYIVSDWYWKTGDTRWIETYCLRLVLENRRHPVDWETPRSELVLENRRHPVDRETPRSELVLENRRHSVDREIPRPGLVSGSGRHPAGVEKHFDLDRRPKSETPGRVEKHLGSGEIWSGSGPDALVVPAYILGRGIPLPGGSLRWDTTASEMRIVGRASERGRMRKAMRASEKDSGWER